MKQRRLGRDLVPALVGPGSFALAAFVGARRVPDYRHRDEPMSALAAKHCPASPIMVAGFLGLGAATWSLAGAIEGTRVPRSVAVMMRTTSVATALAGLARQSDRSCPVRFMGDEDVTVADDLHVLFSVVAFGSWIAMPLVTATRGRALRRVDRRRSLVLGVGALCGWVWTSILVQRDAQTWGGVAQRVTVATALAWYPVAAVAANA
jgi:Protein of unknown function (DUF998)